MQTRRPILFHRLIRNIFLAVRRSAVVVFKVSFLIVTGCRKLQVEIVSVNNAFLLANGMVIIHWRVRNALWIRVNGKWMGSRRDQVMMLPAHDLQTVTIIIQGLFSSYEKQFALCPQAKLTLAQPQLPDWIWPVNGNSFRPVFSSILHGSIGAAGVSFRPVVLPMAFILPSIPPIQTENQYETGLLHHS